MRLVPADLPLPPLAFSSTSRRHRRPSPRRSKRRLGGVPLPLAAHCPAALSVFLSHLPPISVFLADAPAYARARGGAWRPLSASGKRRATLKSIYLGGGRRQRLARMVFSFLVGGLSLVWRGGKGARPVASSPWSSLCGREGQSKGLLRPPLYILFLSLLPSRRSAHSIPSLVLVLFLVSFLFCFLSALALLPHFTLPCLLSSLLLLQLSSHLGWKWIHNTQVLRPPLTEPQERARLLRHGVPQPLLHLAVLGEPGLDGNLGGEGEKPLVSTENMRRKKKKKREKKKGGGTAIDAPLMDRSHSSSSCAGNV